MQGRPVATIGDPALFSPTMHLFLVVLGGRTPHSHVELHDVRWVVGTSIDDTIPELKRQWFGSRKGLHLDSYVEVRSVDGYSIRLHRTPKPNSPLSFSSTSATSTVHQRLWFVNMGAYAASSLLELHQCGCVVAPNPQAAKRLARQRFLKGGLQQHKDDLHALDAVGGVDDCLPIEELQGWRVHLVHDPDVPSCTFIPDWFGYRPI